MQFNKIHQNQGVVLLYAVLMVSIVLTISLSLLNITYKQIILTAVSRESQISHFNAWSAVDCVLSINRSFGIQGSLDEMDTNPFGYFTYNPSFNLSVGTDPVTNFICGSGDGQIYAVVDSNPQSIENHVISSYKMTGLGLNNACAIVEIAKVSSGNYDNYPGEPANNDDDERVMISSLGYNGPQPCTGGQNSRLVERRIRKRE